MSILSKIAREFQRGQRAINTQIMRVAMKPSSLVSVYAEKLHYNYTRHAPNNLSNAIPSLEEFQVACSFIIKARIIQVNGGRLPERPSSRAWVIPHGLNAIIEFIGKVIVREQDLVIEPSFDGTLTEEQWKEYRKVAYFMTMMDDVMPVAYTLPRQEEGNYEFMMFVHTDDVIRSAIPNAEPGSALASAFIHAECLMSVVNPRFNYGTISEYEMAAEYLAFPTSGVAT